MRRTLIYAHRGASREAAENTRTAFERALSYPIDGIETDIQLTQDGVCVLWHDDDMARLGLPGRRIADYTCAELQAMNVAAHFPGAAAEGIMRLEDFVATYRDRCRLLLEIKRTPGEAEAAQQSKVRQTLAAAGAADGRVWVSSFDPDSLLHAHQLVPDFPLVLNLEPWQDAVFARQVLGDQPWLHGLCVHIATLNEAMAEAVQGRPLAVYTANAEEEIARALRLEVDILISDLPQQALNQRERT